MSTRDSRERMSGEACQVIRLKLSFATNMLRDVFGVLMSLLVGDGANYQSERGVRGERRDGGGATSAASRGRSAGDVDQRQQGEDVRGSLPGD